MSSLNQCNFIGHVGKIETRYMPDGDMVVNLSLACNETWKDKTTGEKKEKTEWINVVIYRKLAEIADKYVSKGQQIYISGKMETRKWQDSNGNNRYSTEIIANDLKMLGSKQSDSTDSKPINAAKDYENVKDGSGFEDMEDSIPF